MSRTVVNDSHYPFIVVDEGEPGKIHSVLFATSRADASGTWQNVTFITGGAKRDEADIVAESLKKAGANRPGALTEGYIS